MTRDEARFKLLEGTKSRCTESFIDDFLDSAVALGILQLDEPKTIDQKLDLAIAFLGPAATHAELKYALDAQGLCIVEK